jgi:hypothetical protein
MALCILYKARIQQQLNKFLLWIPLNQLKNSLKILVKKFDIVFDLFVLNQTIL